MKISFRAGRGDKVSVSCGGEFVANVDSGFIRSCGHTDNEEIDGAELAAFIEAVRLRSAFLGAMRLLSIRDYGKKELENKLTEKGHKREYARAATDLALEYGYIDDDAYAAHLAARLVEEKGYSVRRARQELLAKGISREIADEACENIDIEPVLRIIELLNSKYSRSLDTEKGVKKTVAALQRLGYRYSDIRQALSEMDTVTPQEDYYL